MDPGKITGIRSVVLYVADVARSRQFYEGVLGLPVQQEVGGRVEIDLGPTRLLLHPTDIDTHDLADARHGRTEVYYQVANIDAVVDELTGAGIELVQPPTSEPWGERDACILDPDGYPIFLTEPINSAGR